MNAGVWYGVELSTEEVDEMAGSFDASREELQTLSCNPLKTRGFRLVGRESRWLLVGAEATSLVEERGANPTLSELTFDVTRQPSAQDFCRFLTSVNLLPRHPRFSIWKI